MLNPYFAGESKALKSELRQLQGMITEAIQIYGVLTRYIPRVDGKFDRLLGEDAIPTFTTAVPIEMYLETNKGPEGSGDVFSKFGLDIRDSFKFTASYDRWEKAIKPYHPDLHRPREGDLLSLNFGNLYDGFFELYEIKWVEHESPFEQLGQSTMYKISAEKFRYSNERFETGIPVLDQYRFLSGTNKLDFRLQTETGDNIMLENSDHGIIFDTSWQNDSSNTNTIMNPDSVERHSRQVGDNDMLQKSTEDVVEFSVNNPFGDEF